MAWIQKTISLRPKDVKLWNEMVGPRGRGGLLSQHKTSVREVLIEAMERFKAEHPTV